MSLAALFDQASALHRRGALAQAEQLYRQLIAADPQHPLPRLMLGSLHQEQGRFAEALSLIETVNPKNALAYTKRANVLAAMGRSAEAEVDYGRAIELDGNFAEALFNRALLLANAARHAEALNDYDRALALDPRYAEGHNKRGWCLLNMRRLPEAMASFTNALNADPNLAGARLNQGLWHLLQGDFAAGLPLYEFRKHLPQPVEARSYPQPLWSGREDITGKHVFVYVEQGLGDAIQFFRFADALTARGARVTLTAPKPLLPLLNGAGQPLTLIDLGTPPGAFDFHIPLMSLPLALGVRAETIPAPPAYLRAEPARVQDWKQRLGEGFRIGIAWHGAASAAGNPKSIPLDAFAALAGQPGVRLISLQKRNAGDAALPSWLKVFDDMDAGPGAFLDSAAVIANLDLVIAADTAIAHLAGALGAPAWVALNYVPDWRWMLDRTDTPWYPKTRLFRQAVPGDWNSVFAAIGEALAVWRQRGPEPGSAPKSLSPA